MAGRGREADAFRGFARPELREQFPDLRREEAWLALSMLNDETQDAVRRFLERR